MKRFNVTAPLAALLAALAFTLALTSCSNSLVEKPGEAASVPAGFGTVRVSLGEGLGAARTVMPAVSSVDYFNLTYTFTKDGESEEKIPENGVFTLEAGDYTLTVKAYVKTVEPGLAAEGSATFVVNAGEEAQPVEVTLSPIVSGGTGTLKYTFTFPEGAAVATLTLTRLVGTGASINLIAGSGVALGTTYTKPDVDAGYWLLEASLINAEAETTAGLIEVVHIYQNLETVAVYTVDVAKFHSITISSVAALTAYLTTLPPGDAGSPTTTKPLELVFNTGDTVPDGQIPWAEINAAVVNSKKYVILDLSASTAANDDTATTIVGNTGNNANAFSIIKENSYIKGIILPNTLTSIGYAAFGACNGLTSVTIPASVTSIEDAAFIYCSGLTSVTIPNGVESIGPTTFSGCTNLASVDIPDTVTSIGEYAFQDCSSLTSVIIPNGVESIGPATFYGCTKLASVDIPDTVTSIGSYAFADCKLASVTIPDNVTSIGNYAFFHCYSLNQVTIPGKVETIGNYAFQNCTNLESVTITSNGTTIGGSAFKDCTNLASVTIPGNVTNVTNVTTTAGGAFSGCTKLASMTITGPTVLSTIGTAFSSSKGFKITDVIIAEGVQTIGPSVFAGWTSLARVTIPGSVTYIGDAAFGSCTGLYLVTFGADITASWNNNAFPNNSGTSLLNAYKTGKAGTYQRSGNASAYTWTKQP